MAEIIKARVWTKIDTLEAWNANPLILGTGEFAPVLTAVGGSVYNFKVGTGDRRFSDLPWSLQTPGVAIAADTNTVFPTGVPGLYIPTESGTYEGVAVDLEAGYTQLIWDGATLVKVEFPIDLSGYVSKTDINGEVKSGEEKLVSGGEVFDKTLTKEIYLSMVRESVNLFDKSEVTYNRSLTVNGDIYTTTSPNFGISDYIPVKEGVLYSASGWFVSSSNWQAALFDQIDDTECIEYFPGVDQFVPSQDGYLVLRVASSTGDTSPTLQVQEGEPTPYEPYSPIVNEKIKEEYLPDVIVNRKTASFNRLDPDLLQIGFTVDNSGAVVEGDIDDYVFGPIIPEQSSYIYARNMPPSKTHTLTLIKQDGDLNFRGQVSFVGSSGTTRNRPNTYRVYLSGKFDDEIDLSKCSLSFFRASDPILLVGADALPVSRTLPNPIYPRLSNRLVKPEGGETYTYRQFNINHTGTDGEEVIIPVFMNWGSAPDGTPARERFLFMQEKCHKDFSNISVINVATGEKVPIEVNAGNYALIPASSGYMAMFQDPNDPNVIIGANRSGGLFMSTNYGASFSSMGISAQLCFMATNGDIFYMKKDASSAEICRATKAASYADDTTVQALPYQSSVISPEHFCEDDGGNIYFGTYQNEYDTRVYKSTNGGDSFTMIFQNTDHQHTHKLYFEAESKELWLSVDGAVDQFQNNGVPPDVGMALYKSDDYGGTWSLVALPFTSDYGNRFKLGDYYFGSGEANIKYTPSIFRTRDYSNIEVLSELPAMTSVVRKFGNAIIAAPQAYRDHGYTSLLLSHDLGKSFMPIFTTGFVQSLDLGYAYRYGNEEPFVDEDGGEFLYMVSDTNDLPPMKLYMREDDYQAVVYVKAKLEAGDNYFQVIEKAGDNPVLQITRDTNECFHAHFTENGIKSSNGIITPYNQDTLKSVGVYKSLRFPYQHDGISVNIPQGVTLDVGGIGIKTIRFGYKAVTNNSNGVVNDVSILKSEGFDIRRNVQSLVVKIGIDEYTFPNVFRSQFAFAPIDIVLTFNGASIALYANGFLVDEIAASVAEVDVPYLSIQNPESSYLNKNTDLISDIRMYDITVSQADVVKMFEGVLII